MKFRRNCFTVFALAVVVLGIVWAAVGVSETEKDQPQSEAEEIGQDIGQGIGVTVIACVTLLLFALFSLLAWRNGAGLATERRHQEQIAVAREQGRREGATVIKRYEDG